MATLSEVSELDSGVASPETTPEVQDPLRKTSSIGSDSKTSPSKSNPEKEESTTESTSNKEIILPSKLANDMDDEDDDNLDESLAERLWGLTEMFPDSVRSVSSSVTQKSLSFIKASYQFSRQVVWISVSTSLLLFAPVMFEVERFNVEEMVKQDRNRLVLGPGSGMSVPTTGPPPASR